MLACDEALSLWFIFYRLVAMQSTPKHSDPDVPISREDIERLRTSGYAIVPLRPTPEMQKIGAPICYQAYNGDWTVALRDAKECYQAMIECGCL